MTTMYMPVNGEEAFRMLPSSIQAEYAITEHSHWTDCDAYRDLGQLALSALRACRVHINMGMLVMLDDGRVCIRSKRSVYKQLPSITLLGMYMTQEQVFEYLCHSGIAYLLSMHPAYML